MEKTKKNRIKKVILAALAVAAVACITSSMTLAYLTKQDARANVFQGSPDVTAALFEPNWDNSSKDKPVYKDKSDEQIVNELKEVNGGNVTNPNEPFGMIEAQSYKNDGSKDSRILKNPKMANTSKYDEYVAMCITYKVKLNLTSQQQQDMGDKYNVDDDGFSIVTPEEFKKLVKIEYDATYSGTGTKNYNEDAWEKLNLKNTDKNELYVYKTKVSKDAETYELFSYISVAESVIPGQDYCLKDGQPVSIDTVTNPYQEGHTIINLNTNDYTMPEFKIEIVGGVIKAEENSANNPDDEAKAALAKLFNLEINN